MAGVDYRIVRSGLDADDIPVVELKFVRSKQGSKVKTTMVIWSTWYGEDASVRTSRGKDEEVHDTDGKLGRFME